MPNQTRPYDVAEYLTDEEMISAYLAEALVNNDARDISQAINDVVRARGLARLACDTGIDYKELVLTLNPNEKHHRDKLLAILDALGVKAASRNAA